MNKITNYANQGNNSTTAKTNQRNVSPINNHQVIFNVKTKIEKKAFLNSSDILVKTETSNKNLKNNSTNKHNYSRSIDTKEHNDTHLVTTTNNTKMKTNNKSPLTTHIYKK